ncbi:chemotaxis protein CheW [Metabacillus herbersteinensis]|uniref:Chemotaxis protein CheW n=1 Tax=Metabacillus herbersteinensis TaxID=283816 RepID=A0ABV6G9G6_9BACI
MNASKVVVFRAGTEEYGLPIQHVISIEKMIDVKPIPTMPIYMRGVVKVRGELIPVVDVGYVFYQQNTEIMNETKLIVIQTDLLSIALIVQEAKEILDIQKDQLKSISFGAFQTVKYFAGVASVNERLITILNPTLLIESLDLTLVKEEIGSH